MTASLRTRDMSIRSFGFTGVFSPVRSPEPLRNVRRQISRNVSSLRVARRGASGIDISMSTLATHAALVPNRCSSANLASSRVNQSLLVLLVLYSVRFYVTSDKQISSLLLPALDGCILCHP